MASLEGGLSVALDLVKQDGIASLKELVGPESVEAARSKAPTSLRAKHGLVGLKNGIHVSHSTASADKVVP